MQHSNLPPRQNTDLSIEKSSIKNEYLLHNANEPKDSNSSTSQDRTQDDSFDWFNESAF
jgi:hypothetical protein